MTDDKEFIDGFYAKKANVDFVKCKISIKLSEFREWAKSNLNKEDEWLNIDVKESRDGNFYAERNTWKPDEKKPEPKEELKSLGDSIPNDSIPEDIPF